MALPVISTNVSGIPELIQHEENDLLLPAGEPEVLAESLQRLIVDSSLRKNLGTRARQFITMHYNLTRNTQRLLQNIRAVIKQDLRLMMNHQARRCKPTNTAETQVYAGHVCDHLSSA